LLIALGRLAGQGNGGSVDFLQLVFQPKCGEFVAVGAKRVGLDDLGPRLEILAVDSQHEIGAGAVELIEAGAHRYPAGVQQGSHGAVGQARRSRLKPMCEWRAWIQRLCRRVVAQVCCSTALCRFRRKPPLAEEEAARR
jgi:hypothetical protein